MLRRLPVPVWVVRAPEGELTFANARAAELTGDGAAQRPDDRYLASLSLLDEQGRPLHRTRLPLYRAIHEGLEIRDFEATVLRPDGSLTAAVWNTTVLRGADGRIAAAVAVMQDIDVRFRRESRLKQSLARLEQSSKRRTRFFSALCHDLRSRLNNINLAAESLAARPGVSADSAAAEDVAELKRTMRQMADALDEMLSPAQARRPGGPPIESFPLNELLEESAASVTPQAARGVKIRVEPCDPPVRLRSDRNRLRQVLAHLLHNAVRFTERGQVTLSARAPAGPGERLRITVRDTGSGIPPDRQKSLFDDAPGTSEKHSAAMQAGLPLCRRWADLLGAWLEVQSTPGAGSVFSVLMPAESVMPAGDLDPEIPPLVLVVEDDPMTRRALARLLRGFGYRTLEAVNGREGVEIATREQPSLVLMDLMMPELDGMEAIRVLRDDPRTRAIPTIIVTGDITEDRRNTADELRVEGWLDKPVDVPRLRELVAGLLR